MAVAPDGSAGPPASAGESWFAVRRNRIRGVFRRETLGKDALAGTILGIESVPDGLAIGLLAGVNPVAGIYAFLFGMAGAALATSSSFMAVQATGAMALIVSDTDLGTRPDPDRALFTLAMLTGVFMIIAGLLKGGRMLRFVPTAVMVGFVTAVGVNIVLGQLTNLTGYAGRGANRLFKAIDTFAHVGQFELPTLTVGLVTIALIVVLTRTPLRSLGLVVAIAVGSGLAALFTYVFDWPPVLTVGDVADVPTGLPLPVLPTFDDLAYLALPALSLAFVGLVQGAAVAAGVPNSDGKPADDSRNFIGQGVGNIVSGVFRGMPVGGSMSASALIVAAGARTRLALFIGAVVMSLVILLASGIVSFVAMPALAGLLIVVGVKAIKPARIQSVVKTGALQTAIMAVTFVLTLIIPLQFAVLVGVGLGIILFVAQQSNRLRVRQLEFHGEGRLREIDPVPSFRRTRSWCSSPTATWRTRAPPCSRRNCRRWNRNRGARSSSSAFAGSTSSGCRSSRCSTATSPTSSTTIARCGSWSPASGSAASSRPADCSTASGPIGSTRARSGSARPCTARTAMPRSGCACAR